MYNYYNYNKLKGRIVEKCGTQENFAKALGKTSTHISKVLNNKSFFKQTDIDRAAVVLDIKTNEIGTFFFVKE